MRKKQIKNKTPLQTFLHRLYAFALGWILASSFVFSFFARASDLMTGVSVAHLEVIAQSDRELAGIARNHPMTNEYPSRDTKSSLNESNASAPEKHALSERAVSLVGSSEEALDNNLEKSSTTTYDELKVLLTAEILKMFPRAKIQLDSEVTWLQGEKISKSSSDGSPQKKIASVSIQSMDSRGNAHFLVQLQTRRDGELGQIEGGEINPASPIREGSHPKLTESRGKIRFSAWLEVPIALRRVLPGEKLRQEFFNPRFMNVASGRAYEYRGILFDPSQSVENLEAKNTILEGQFLTSAAVRTTPDLKRGASVRIRFISGNLVLNTVGLTGEPAYRNESVKVFTHQSKKELSGILTDDGVVEVKL